MTNRGIVFSIVLLAIVGALPASAGEAPSRAERAQASAETRQGLFKIIGFNMGGIIGMARGAVPFDAAIAERNAKRIAALAPMIPEVFAAMDTREFDVETEALPVIWENVAEFEAAAANLVDAANAFAANASGGDQATTLGGLRSFGGACGNCHDNFREDTD